jgi:RNA polymerase primary sigma factor
MMHPANKLTTPLDRKEVVALIELAQAGDRKAKDKVILSFYRFVVVCANKYFGRGIPMEDLISEGQIGLVRAVELFDISRNVSFGSYCVWWIRSYQTSLVQEQSLPVRVPANFYFSGKIPNSHTLKNQALTQEEREAKNAARIERNKRIVEAVRSSPQLQHENEFENSLVYEGEQADSLAVAALNKKRVAEILAQLPPREQDLLRRRYGLDGAANETLADVGRAWGVSRERVRQIENIAKRELKRKYRKEEP